LYEKTGALMRGHFRLTSGLHSDIYLQSALVLQYPEHAARLGDALAAPFVDAGAQTVLAPAIGGILVAHEVARALGVRALFTERENGVMRLRRGFALTPRERCLLGLRLRALEVARGGVDVGMPAGTRGPLALRRRGRRRRRRRLRGDRRGDEDGGQGHPGEPEISSHGVSLLRLSMHVRASATRCAP